MLYPNLSADDGSDSDSSVSQRRTSFQIDNSDDVNLPEDSQQQQQQNRQSQLQPPPEPMRLSQVPVHPSTGEYPRPPTPPPEAASAKERHGGGRGASGTGFGETIFDSDAEELDFGYEDAIAKAKEQGRFRLHCLGALIVSIVCFVVWLFIQWGGREDVPWFIFVVIGFVLSLSFHFYIFLRPTKEVFKLHVVWFVTINLLCFAIWYENANFDTFWWFYVFGSWAMVLAAHHAFVRGARKNQPRSETLLLLGKQLYFVFNIFMFMINLDTGTHPWFIYTLYGSSLVLFVVWFGLHGRRRRLLGHAIFFCMTQVLLFLIWLPNHAHPWFVYVILGWGALLALHAWRAPADEGHAQLPQAEVRLPPREPYVEDVRSSGNMTV